MLWSEGSEDSRINIKVMIGDLEFEIWFDRGFRPIVNGRNIESHNHSIFEVHYIHNGSGTLFIDQQEQELKPNTWHIIGPGIYHAIHQNRRKPLTRSYLQFSCHESRQRRGRQLDDESARIQTILNNLKYISRENTTRQIEWINEINEEIENQRIGCYSRIQCLLTLIILDFVREVEPNTRGDISLPNQTKDELRVALIDQFFDRYNQPLTIGDLAKLLNLSTKQTNRVIEEQFQTTFKQKLFDTRIEVAKNLLISTDISIQDISERVGYSLHRSFGYIFKRKTGLTPIEYRIRNKTIKR